MPLTGNQAVDAPPPPLCLVGPRGAGKSSAGALLAAALGRAFVDLDRVLERRHRAPVAALLREGEAGFRARERAALAETLSLLAAGVTRASVLATGGGAVLAPESRALLRTLGRVAYLRAPAEVLGARVARDGAAERPALLAGGPLAEAAAVLAAREPLYLEVAERVVDATRPLEEVVAELVAWGGS
ncbi:MAG: shikimate kinase [Planctomycetota bacterium]